jgi:hypothetical protein
MEIMSKAKQWTDQQVVQEMQTQSRLNLARRAFSNWSAKIDQAQRQRKPLGPIEMRRMEFEAVEAIVAEYNAP